MTNEQIIFQHRLKLREDGIIGSTDQMIIIEHDDGSKESVFMPEEIHSFKGWKDRGFSVKKGEHHIAAFPIWLYTRAKKNSGKSMEEDEPSECPERIIQKQTYFFSASQVIPQ